MINRVRALSLLMATACVAAGCSSSKPIQSCGLPDSFSWTSSEALLSPISDATHSLVAIKDPSVVFYNNQWYVFVSTIDAAGNYSMAQISFADWDHVADATIYYLDQTPALQGYHAAPQIFFFRPQNKWYLVFQSGPPQYSTNDDITKPAGWTTPKSFYDAEPATLTENKGATGGWLDFWVICDNLNCYLFFSDDAGHWYRAKTTAADFPAGFGEPAVVLRDDASPTSLFEASNVYRPVGVDKYLAIIEGFDASSNDKRYFRSWTADTLDGDWTVLQDTYTMPFASPQNVTFPTQPAWTQDISHGEMIRFGFDQFMTVDQCHLQYVYQGVDPTMTGPPYNSLPWRLGLLTTASPPPPPPPP